jgi:hypothetical protein
MTGGDALMESLSSRLGRKKAQRTAARKALKRSDRMAAIYRQPSEAREARAERKANRRGV